MAFHCVEERERERDSNEKIKVVSQCERNMHIMKITSRKKRRSAEFSLSHFFSSTHKKTLFRPSFFILEPKMEAEHAHPPPAPPSKLHAFIREEMGGGDKAHEGRGGGGGAQAEAAPATTTAAACDVAVVGAAAASGAVPTAAGRASKKAARVAYSVAAAVSAAAIGWNDIRNGFVAVPDKEKAVEMAEA